MKKSYSWLSVLKIADWAFSRSSSGTVLVDPVSLIKILFAFEMQGTGNPPGDFDLDIAEDADADEIFMTFMPGLYTFGPLSLKKTFRRLQRMAFVNPNKDVDYDREPPHKQLSVLLIAFKKLPDKPLPKLESLGLVRMLSAVESQIKGIAPAVDGLDASVSDDLPTLMGKFLPRLSDEEGGAVLAFFESVRDKGEEMMRDGKRESMEYAGLDANDPELKAAFDAGLHYVWGEDWIKVDVRKGDVSDVLPMMAACGLDTGDAQQRSAFKTGMEFAQYGPPESDSDPGDVSPTNGEIPDGLVVPDTLHWDDEK